MTPEAHRRQWLLPVVVSVACGCGTWLSAVEEELPGPLTVSVGWSYFMVGTRSVTSPQALALGVAWHTQDTGLYGQWGLKTLYRRAASGEGRLDDLGVLYVERVAYDNRVYLGYGAGLWAWRLDDRREVNFGRLHGVGVGVEGLAGYQFNPPSDELRVAIEASLVLVTPTHSFTSSGLALAVLVGF